MSVNSVSSSNASLNTAKYAGLGAAIGAAYNGGAEYLKQSNILKNGDAFITNLEGEAAKSMKFCTPFFKGTQEASDLAKKVIQDNIDKAKEFVKNGKIDYKSVLKKAGAGAAGAAALWGGIYLLCSALKSVRQNRIKEDAKIIADEFQKAQQK